MLRIAGSVLDAFEGKEKEASPPNTQQNKRKISEGAEAPLLRQEGSASNTPEVPSVPKKPAITIFFNHLIDHIKAFQLFQLFQPTAWTPDISSTDMPASIEKRLL